MKYCTQHGHLRYWGLTSQPQQKLKARLQFWAGQDPKTKRGNFKYPNPKSIANQADGTPPPSNSVNAGGVSWQLLLYSATRIKLQRQIIGQHFSGSFQIVGDKQYLIRGVTWNHQLNFSACTATPDGWTMIWHFYQLEGNRPANRALAAIGGLTGNISAFAPNQTPGLGMTRY